MIFMAQGEAKKLNKKDMHKGAAIACGLLALGFLLFGNFLAFSIFLAVAVSATYLYFKEKNEVITK